MKSIEDKGCLNYGISQESSGSNGGTFEFHKGSGGTNRTSSHHRTALGKPTPSKWDDAQKWLVNLSRGGEKSHSKAKPRNSNADDRRLIAPIQRMEEEYDSGEERGGEGEGGRGNYHGDANSIQYEMETKKVECDESIWRINKTSKGSTSVVRSICVRDMGTEMTPVASQEPSRTATPLKATTPTARSPISSGCSTPIRCQNGTLPLENGQNGMVSTQSGVEGISTGNVAARRYSHDGVELNGTNIPESKSSQAIKELNPLETRAMAWDEAERAKYMARFKREEVKIQAWENHQKRKAEMEMRRMEVKAERLKSRAQERYTNKLAATRRIAEEKRSNAEAKLNEKAVKTSERADYIRRTGHLPSSFSFKLPNFCW